MTACPSLATEGAFLSSLLDHLDCQGRTIGAVGYQALAESGSPISIALTGILTIFIALFGLRMILGAPVSVRESVLAVAKIGVVLLIATSWPAFRTVIHDVIVEGPAQLATAIGGPSALPGSNGDLTPRLQRVDSAVVRLTTLGSGRNDLTSQTPVGPNGVTAQAERAPIADDLAFSAARVAFLSSVVAASALVDLGAGVLLALAPLFASLLLFDMTRGLFAGWLRALVFIVLASVTVTVLLGVELALLEPWVSRMLQLRQARLIVAQAPTELLVLCLAFALALAGSMALLLRLAFMTHIALSLPRIDAIAERFRRDPGDRKTLASSPETASTRAFAVANAVAAAQRRESTSRTGAARSSPVRLSGRTGEPQATGSGARAASAMKRAKPRKSLASTLRDRKA